MFENIVFVIVLIVSLGFSIYFYLDAVKKERRIHRHDKTITTLQR